MLRPSLLASAQDAVASAFLGEGIKVVWDAEVPYADFNQRVIHLRSLPENISEDDAADIRADCDHELAHFLYSDQTALDNINDETILLVANAIEDGAIERRHGARYVGAKENMERSNIHYINELKRLSSKSNKHIRLTTALTLLAYGKSTSRTLDLLGEDIAPEIKLIEKLVPLLGEVASTHDSVRLAQKISTIWELTPQSDQVTCPAGVDETELGSVHAKNRALTISDLRKTKIAGLRFDDQKYYHADTSRDTEDRVPEVDELKFPDVHKFFMEQVRLEASVLRRRLTMALRSMGEVERRCQRRGAVDDRLLHKLAIGDLSVFKAPARAPVFNSDVTIMVDSSGSMVKVGKLPRADKLLSHRVKTRLWTAAQSAASCSMVLDAVGVTNEVLAWTTHPQQIDGHFNRTTPLRHMIVKHADQSFKSCQRRFSDLALFDYPADNVDGESILWGARRLAKRARRCGKAPLLIVFSDGEPLAVSENKDDLINHLKMSVRQIERAGVRVFGIGLQTDCVAEFYPKWARIDNLTDLTPTLYDLLRSEIRKS